jgi:hypothetical protein
MNSKGDMHSCIEFEECALDFGVTTVPKCVGKTKGATPRGTTPGNAPDFDLHSDRWNPGIRHDSKTMPEMMECQNENVTSDGVSSPRSWLLHRGHHPRQTPQTEKSADVGRETQAPRCFFFFFFFFFLHS